MRVLLALSVVLAQPLLGLYDPPSAPFASTVVTDSTWASNPPLDTAFTPYTAPLAPQPVVPDAWSTTSWDATISTQFDGALAPATFDAGFGSETWAGGETQDTTLSATVWGEPLPQDRYLSLGNSWDTPVPVPVYTDSYASLSTFPASPRYSQPAIVPIPIYTEPSPWNPPTAIPIWTERPQPTAPISIPIWTDRNVPQYGLLDPSEAHDPYRPAYPSNPSPYSPRPILPPRSTSSWQHNYFQEFSSPPRY